MTLTLYFHFMQRPIYAYKLRLVVRCGAIEKVTSGFGSNLDYPSDNTSTFGPNYKVRSTSYLRVVMLAVAVSAAVLN